jgi:putative redox protein
MYANVTWKGRMSFTGTAKSGFEIPLGAAPSVGGDNDGFRPLELMALGLAGCTGMDVISILQKKRQEVTGFDVNIEVEQADSYPHVFTYVQVEYIIQGKNVDPKAVERAIELSATKYCPASAMLEKAVEIEHTYKILDQAEKEAI